MFNEPEILIMLGSVNLPIDLGDLRKHTTYEGPYNDADATIIAFWEVVDSFDEEQRRALLKFVTGCDRPPLLGFKELAPNNFTVRHAGWDEQHLPTASTCSNLLKLPRYTKKEDLRKKLLEAFMTASIAPTDMFKIL